LGNLRSQGLGGEQLFSAHIFGFINAHKVGAGRLSIAVELAGFGLSWQVKNGV
jgi:hypothetical protein